MPLSRRQFLSRTAAVTALAAGATPALARRRMTARRADEVRIAVVGVNGRGRDHVDSFLKVPGVKVVTLCDCDADVLARELKRLTDKGHSAEGVADYRRLLERTDVDAVAIATPNHWHALMGVWACQAGKDVYLEKPVSHNVWEGRQVVAAARKHNRIVQAGTQARSSTAIADAIAWMREGNLGTIKLARGLCYKPRKSIGKADGSQKLPANLDYDLWTGPAPMKPLARNRLHYDWHWDFDTGNADLGNQGIHQMDVCRWALGERGLPPTVLSVGARLGYEDDGNTPNTQIVHFGYTIPLVFEVRGLPRDAAAQAGTWDDAMDKHRGVSIGSVIECEGGDLVIGSDYSRARAQDSTGKTIKEWRGTKDHFANFIDAVRSRRASDLAADIEEGHISSALCHLGNISHRAGSASPNSGIAGALDTLAPACTEGFNRMAAHLEANKVYVDRTPLALGECLLIRPGTETIAGTPAAIGLLRGDYRAPFTVPSDV